VEKKMMTDLERTIQAIEHGLLPIVRGENILPVPKELTRRMEHYHVPGVSVALVFQEELVWAKGYGVMAKMVGSWAGRSHAAWRRWSDVRGGRPGRYYPSPGRGRFGPFSIV
jgi:hypothetical protein